ncbi:MAG: 50S ribosomal protein L4 [Smithellaceae bacterium]|nr:50S ribosomal protein L4 [Smithellaceae bacterium]
MPILDVYDINRAKVDQVELSDAIFNAKVNESVIYDVVRMQLAARRRGTSATKTRGEIRGGGKKPWRQKGTGRARSGTSRSPLWRGGGTVFGPQPRSFAIKVPKKVRRLALISALSMKVQNEKVLVLKDFPMAEIKTKSFKAVMDLFDWGKTLFVIDNSTPTLQLSSRNIKGVKMVRSEGINVYDLLDYDQVVFLEPSIRNVEEALLANG